MFNAVYSFLIRHENCLEITHKRRVLKLSNISNRSSRSIAASCILTLNFTIISAHYEMLLNQEPIKTTEKSSKKCTHFTKCSHFATLVASLILASQ